MAQLQQQPQQQVQPTQQRTGVPRYQQQRGGTTGRYGASRSQQVGGQQAGGQQVGGQQVGGGQQQFGGGQQLGGGQQQFGGGMAGQRGISPTGGISAHFEDTMTSEMRQALDDFSKVDKACEWAVDQSLGQGMPEVVRVLRDIADLAEVNEKLLVRSSKVGPYAAVAFIEAATESLQDLQQHSVPHVVETLNVITRAIDTTQKLLASIGWTAGTSQVGQQSGQQFGQQIGQQQTQPGGQQMGRYGSQQPGQQGVQTSTYY